MLVEIGRRRKNTNICNIYSVYAIHTVYIYIVPGYLLGRKHVKMGHSTTTICVLSVMKCHATSVSRSAKDKNNKTKYMYIYI